MRFVIFTCGFLFAAQVYTRCECFDLSSIPSSVFRGGEIAGRFFYENTICAYKECCDKVHIPANFDGLQEELNEKIYGQHLAKTTVVDALRAHWNNPHTKKALTLSFHGRPGTGKNYISKFIVNAMYSKGVKSKYVHHYMGRIHFPNEDKIEEYKVALYNEIKESVLSCPNQLFIFDEVDKMPPGILDILKPIIDYNENVEKVDYRRCVFVFLSNTGASLIIDEMLKLWKAGKSREEIRISDFDQLISIGAFNEKGGFHRSDTIRSNLIDHYIPFLPMEMEHVKLCIKDEFATYGVYYPKEEHVKEILDYIVWGPEPGNKFANTGCKRLSQKVALLAQKYYARKDEL